MKHLYLFFLVILSHHLFSQERISNIQGEGQLNYYYLAKIDSSSYALSLDKFDSLSVFVLKNGAFEFLHGQRIAGLSYLGFDYIRFNGRYFYSLISQKNYIYNFVEDEFLTNINGVNIYPSDFNNENEHEVLVLKKDTSGVLNSYIINLKYKTSEYFPGYGFAITNNLLFKVDKDSIVIAQNRFNNGLDTIFYDAAYHYNQLVDKDLTVFIEKNKIYTYDNVNQTKKFVADVIAKDIYKYQILNFKDYFLCVAFSKNSFEENVYIIQKNNNASSLVKLRYDSRSFNPRQFRDKILFYHDNMLSLLSKDGSIESLTYTSDNRANFVIYNDRYIIHRFGQYFHIYDYDTKKEIENNLKISYGGIKYFQSLDIDNNTLLLNYGHQQDDFLKLYDLNKNTLEITASSLVPGSNNGISESSSVEKIGNDLFVVGKDVYLIDKGKVTKINDYPLRSAAYTFYKEINEKLHWIEVSPTEYLFYKFENGIKILKAHLPAISTEQNPIPIIVVDYFSTSNYTILFTGGFEDKVFKNIHGSNDWTEIGDITLTGATNFYEYKDELYFSNSGLYKIDKNFNIVKLKEFSSFISNDFFVLNNKLYLLTFEELIEINGNIVSTILSDLSYAGLAIKNDNFVLIDNYADIYYFDGVTSPSKIPGQLDEKFVYFQDNLLVNYKPISTNVFEISFKNFLTGLVYNLPPAVKNQRPVKFFKNQGKTFYITSNSKPGNYDIFIYETDSLLSTFNLIKQFTSTGRSLYPVYIPVGSEGLLYAGSEIYLMGELLNFELLNVKGDALTNNIKEKGGYFYFMGIHPELGRQVYRVQLMSLRVATKDPLKENFRIYPNPSNGIFYIASDRPIPYHLYDISGKLIEKSIDNKIDLTKENNGLYFIEFDGINRKQKLVLVK